MITPDEIPFVPGIIAVVVFSILWLGIELRAAAVDPNPELSRLDRLDGLDSRTD